METSHTEMSENGQILLLFLFKLKSSRSIILLLSMELWFVFSSGASTVNSWSFLCSEADLSTVWTSNQQSVCFLQSKVQHECFSCTGPAHRTSQSEQGILFSVRVRQCRQCRLLLLLCNCWSGWVWSLVQLEHVWTLGCASPGSGSGVS